MRRLCALTGLVVPIVFVSPRERVPEFMNGNVVDARASLQFGAGSDQLRRVVEQAVAETWQAHSQLQFRGWEACAPNNRGIRIRIAEDGPHTKGLGRFLDGKKDGMVLNFTFAS